MKKMLLAAGVTLAIAAAPVAFVSAQGFSYHNGQAQGSQMQLHTQDQTHLTAQDQARDRDQLRLQDGTGDRHANCDGTPGDMHRYHVNG